MMLTCLCYKVERADTVSIKKACVSPRPYLISESVWIPKFEFKWKRKIEHKEIEDDYNTSEAQGMEKEISIEIEYVLKHSVLFI